MADPFAPAVPDAEVWRLTSSTGKRQAVCLARRHLLGIELVVEVDGEPYYTQVHRDVTSFDDEAEALKARMVGKGWRPNA